MSHFSRHIIILIFLVDLLLSVCILAEQKLSGVDSLFYTAVARLGGAEKGTHAQLHFPHTPVRMEQTLLHRHHRSYPTVHHIVWEADPAENGSAPSRPKIQELATILDCLANKWAVRTVGISTPLVWEDTRDEMARHMLARSLQNLDFVGLGIPARNADTTEAMPAQFNDIAIPLQQVEGDPAALPYANSPLPYTWLPAEPTSLLLAPDYVEDEPDHQGSAPAQGLSCPLLMRWRGHILPTLPLRLALARQGLSPADVQVRLGRSIRIGTRLLPLDARGRTPLGAAHAATLPLGDVLMATQPPPQEPQIALITRAFTAGRADTLRGEQLAATLSLLLGAESTTYIPTERPEGNLLFELNPVQGNSIGRVFIAVLIICALIWLPMLPLKEQRIIMLGLALAGGIIGAAWYSRGIWMSLCACILGWFMLYGALHLLRRHLARHETPRA